MANLGYVSTFNVNGNELSLKDAALTEIVNEIIEAIGANNTNIAERINDLHNRSFDNTIKISSQNESEIASIQDGLYKIQYVTVTGEGDNAIETLNDSAILIQKDTTQYLYKDGIISSRTKDNNTWGSWANMDSDHPIKEFTSNTNSNQIEGTLYNEPDGYYLISWVWQEDENTQTWGPELLRKINGDICTLADINNTLFYYDNENNVYNIINFDNLEIKNANTGTTYDTPSLLSPLPASNKSVYDMLQNLGLIHVSENYDEETEKTTYSISLPSDNIEHPIVLAVKDYENYSEEDQQQDNPNYGLYESLMNLDFVKPVGDATYVMPDWIGTVGKTEIAFMFGLIPHEQYESNIYPDRTICDIGLIEVKTVSKQSNFMHQYDYNIEVTEYLLLERKKRTINYLWVNTGGINAFDFRNVEWTDYDYFLKNVNYPVTSVNGQTGAVSLSIPDAQIQADWNQTTTTAKDYIKNKPTIPTVPATSTTVTANDNNPVSGGAVYAKLEDLIGSAPAALDTLGEIAAALNNDADLAGTLTNQIAGKISKVSPATAGNFASLNSDGTLSDSGHKHSDYLTSETQADWNETNTSSAAYINNKPTIKDELSSNYATSTDTNDDLLLAAGDTYEEAFGKLEKAILDNSEVTATAIQEVASNSATAIQEVASNMVTSVNGQTGDVTITIPEGQLSNDYAMSTATNDDLELASGDTYETAFSKLEKAIIDNELVVTAAITDLDSRVTDTESLATVAKSGSYNDLTNRPTIPTKTSDLTNDSGFLTSAPVTSVNGQQGAVTLTLGQTNVIETVKVNNTALTPDANKAVNIDLSNYDKAPLIIEINSTDTTVPSGTYTNIGNALANGQEVYIKLNGDNYSVYYLKLCDDLSRGRSACYDFSSDVTRVSIWSNNTLSIEFNMYAAYEHNHGDIDNDGTLNSSQAISIANGDRIAITDASSNEKIQKTSITFDGSTTTTALTPKGTWETFLKTAPVTSVNGQQGAVTLALGDTNVIETVKVNNSALTPVSKAVNITVPTKTSDLTNDSGFITSAPVTSVNNQTGAVTLALGDANVIETVKVNNTALTPVSKAVNITVPTKTSDLTNDSGFLTQAPVTSVNGATGAVTVKANVQSDWNATSGDAVILNKPTIPTVNDSTVTLTMNGNTVGTFTLNKSGNTTIDLGTVLTSHQSIKTINNQTITGTGNVDISGLPTVTSADNGKVLMVVDGAWQLVSPVSLYSGSSAPSNSQGNNGDIYVQS